MNKMIACCGINYETCEARIATMKNDDMPSLRIASSTHSTRSNENGMKMN